MPPLGYHIRISLEDNRVIARTTSERRALARTVLTIGRAYDLAAFRAPDDHLHMEPFCERREAGELARRVEVALHRRLLLPVRFAAPHIKPLVDQRHGYNAFWYDIGQAEHHGVDVDPWAEASNLPDLLGMRLIGAYTADTVRRFLPRVTIEALLDAMGVSAEEHFSNPPPDFSIDELADAAAAAAALPDLSGRTAEVVAARHAAVVAAGRTVSEARLSERLGLTARTVRRLRARPADLALVEAVRRQLRLRGVMTHRRGLRIGPAPLATATLSS